MKVKALTLPGAYEITPTAIEDERGYFMTTYLDEVFEEHGLVRGWVQENQSLSHQSVLRGLHFQLPPHAETKLVRVLAGAVRDVIVDLRKQSPTFGQWETVELSADNHKLVYVPKGFAHGFCALEAGTLVAYKVDSYYAPKAQAGIRWDDPTLAIAWPCDEPVVSQKDSSLPDFATFESPFTFLSSDSA